MNNHNAAGQYLTQLRKAARYSQTEAAREIGVQQKAISAWETGQSVPNARNLSRYMALLGGDALHYMQLLEAESEARRSERAPGDDDLAAWLEQLQRLTNAYDHDQRRNLLSAIVDALFGRHAPS